MDVAVFLTPEGRANLSKVSEIAAKAIELLDGSRGYPVDFVVNCNKGEAESLLEDAGLYCPKAVCGIKEDIRISLGSRN